MANFSDREKGFEEKFRHDEELRFRVVSRRNRLLGLWAAEKLGLTGADADRYAKEVVAADFQKPGDDDVIAKVMADVASKGIRVTEAEIRKKLGDLAETAKTQVMEELK